MKGGGRKSPEDMNKERQATKARKRGGSMAGKKPWQRELQKKLEHDKLVKERKAARLEAKAQQEELFAQQKARLVEEERAYQHVMAAGSVVFDLNEMYDEGLVDSYIAAAKSHPKEIAKAYSGAKLILSVIR